MTSFGEPRDADAWVRSQTERFAEMREQAEQVRAQLAQNVVTVSDGQATVTVAVGSGGVLQSITFGPRSTQLSADQLSTAVMRTYGQACRQAAERAQQIVSELVGADSSTLQLMRDAVPPDPDADEDAGRRPSGGTP